MFDYVSIEPAFENCTLVEQIFEGVECSGLQIASMDRIICGDEADCFKLTFHNSDVYVDCSSNCGWDSATVKIFDNTDKLEDVITLDAFDDYIEIENTLKKYIKEVTSSEIGYFEIPNSSEPVSNDIVDEETDTASVQSWRTGVSENIVLDPIVPADISDCRVVALIYNNTVVAYRFKTDMGSYDMNKETARKYGLSPDKVTKCTQLLLINSIFMTKGERDAGRLLPDISSNQIDCERLISALFRGGAC